MTRKGKQTKEEEKEEEKIWKRRAYGKLMICGGHKREGHGW